MMKSNMLRQKGFGLTEALIGLVVLSTGLLAIYGVHAKFLQSMADDRRLSQAVFLTQQQMAKVRLDATKNALSSAYPTYTAGEYTIETALSASGETSYVDVTTSWGDGSYSMNSVVLTTSPFYSGVLTENGPQGYNPYKGASISPSGDAVYGDGNVITGEDAVFEEKNSFDLRVVKKDNTYYLLDDSDDSNEGKNLLQSSNLFYKISGQIYLDKSSWDADDFGNFFAGAPDTSVCRTLHPTSYDSSEDYLRTDYICYVGSGWYGSIGLIERDSDLLLTTADVCLGDPSANNVGSAYSRHATNSLTRRYTLYSETTESSAGGSDITLKKYAEIGFPVCNAVDKEAYKTSCIYSNQDFVISNSACATELASVSGSLFGESAASLSSNPGNYVCLDGSDFCPYLITEPYAVSGAVTVEGSVSTQVSGSATSISGATMTFSSTDRVSVVDTSTCYATVGDTAYWKCDVSPAVGEGFSSTWASYGVGDLTISNLPEGCTGDSSKSYQVTSGSSVTVPGIKFGSGIRGQKIYLEGASCAGTPGDTGTGTGTGNSCSFTLNLPDGYTQKNKALTWTYTASNAEDVKISIFDNESDSSKKSSITNTTSNSFKVNNPKDDDVKVTVTLSGTEVGTGDACTTRTVPFTTTNN